VKIKEEKKEDEMGPFMDMCYTQQKGIVKDPCHVNCNIHNNILYAWPKCVLTLVAT